jgi:hypothetical protein
LPYEQNLYGEKCGIGDAFSSSGIPSGTEAGLGKAVTLIDSFILRCAALRHYFDYALFDSHMMLQGFGKQIDTILFVISSPLPKSFCEELELWIQNGGSVLIREGVRLSVWEDGEEYIPGGAKYFCDPPEIQPYASLKRKNGWDASVYVTVHEDFVSVLNPNEFEVAKQIQYRNY